MSAVVLFSSCRIDLFDTTSISNITLDTIFDSLTAHQEDYITPKLNSSNRIDAMSNPAHAMTVYELGYHFERYLQQIDSNRREVEALITELEAAEVVDPLPWCCAMHMLRWMQFWLDVERMYYQLGDSKEARRRLRDAGCGMASDSVMTAGLLYLFNLSRQLNTTGENTIIDTRINNNPHQTHNGVPPPPLALQHLLCATPDTLHRAAPSTPHNTTQHHRAGRHYNTDVLGRQGDNYGSGRTLRHQRPGRKKSTTSIRTIARLERRTTAQHPVEILPAKAENEHDNDG
ncbi:hypothetical protein CC86DRAFT_384455 [Ophiobolus disseminans]|uniref:Uncharacterized protein n=1 Tax=Ophiobolus disseminans TaxID=1469910 RepID=A0A6A6ZU09_9PLEO|nr:hypothetical protein CC86DRAFT_384455 [Ophiobolus disseminans]